MPQINEIVIDELRPTQITVGMIEVEEKRREIVALMQDRPHHLEKYITDHAIPAVAGLDGRYFIVDHHHLGRALSEAGVPSGPFQVIGDLSTLAEDKFWPEMERRNWVHPYDEHGCRQDFTQIPLHLKDLRDDPYRSLAGFVRRAGGYQKTPAPFAEFLWADYFRTRIAATDLIEPQFEATVERAAALAHDPAAAHLPGYIATAALAPADSN
jgi:hypothetical protein